MNEPQRSDPEAQSMLLGSIMRSLDRAIRYEIERHTKILPIEIVQEYGDRISELHFYAPSDPQDYSTVDAPCFKGYQAYDRYVEAKLAILDPSLEMKQ